MDVCADDDVTQRGSEEAEALPVQYAGSADHVVLLEECDRAAGGKALGLLPVSVVAGDATCLVWVEADGGVHLRMDQVPGRHQRDHAECETLPRLLALR